MWTARSSIRALRVIGLLTVASHALALMPPTARRAHAAPGNAPVIQPFTVRGTLPGSDALTVDLRPNALAALVVGPEAQDVLFPVPGSGFLTLRLQRFEVTTAATRFVVATPSGQTEVPPPQVLLLRGHVAGHPDSHAFLAFTGQGSGNGYVSLGGGESYILASDRSVSADEGRAGRLIIHRASPFGSLPEFPEFCGVSPPEDSLRVTVSSVAGRSVAGGPQVARVAIDGDQSFVQLFGNPFTAQAYAVQLLGAVSDLYIRDVDLKLVLGFLRVWPAGGEPFSADSVSSFRNHWTTVEDPSSYNVVHLLSGRRDLPYGGVAYVGGTCSGEATYGISGFLLGGFPVPVVSPNLGNWDLIVMAHEVGHNFGTLHTHDGYIPTIDDCGSGVPSRGTIMSYCHIHPGGTLNTDLRFHRRVQEVMEDDMADGACFIFDCNHNGVHDGDDISAGTSADANGSGVPDECEDCNTNGTLDDVDILLGAADLDADGVPDVCQPDCNGNGVPDAHEIALGSAADENGNNMPDDCDPDCDGDGQPDFDEIAAGAVDDLDRDTVPDPCQDCDANGTTDWIDLDRQFNLYVAGRAGGFVREYHAASGVPVQNLGGLSLTDPYDAVFGPDRQLYVADFAADAIVRIDVDSGAAGEFVPAGSGGLDGPAGLTFGPDGHLYVASQVTASIIRYDGATGAPVDTFVSAGAGGLISPYGLAFGLGGNLFVTSSNNAILEFDGSSGAFVGEFVSPGGGGLSGPRGLDFKLDGDLVVASFNNDRLIVYDGATGADVDVINDVAVTGAWGVRIGPNGNIFAVRSTGTIRVIEYDQVSGRYVRSFVRGDEGLSSPSGLDFRPTSYRDCDRSGVLDACEVFLPGDLDGDGDAEPGDFETFPTCLTGPCEAGPCAPPLYDAVPACCHLADGDADGDVDLADYRDYQSAAAP